MALLRFLKTIEYPEILKENVWKFAWNPGWEGNSHALPTRNSDTFFVKFSVFKNFTSAKVFNIFIPKFSALTNFHLLLQSANIMFSIVPRNVEKGLLNKLKRYMHLHVVVADCNCILT